MSYTTPPPAIGRLRRELPNPDGNGEPHRQHWPTDPTAVIEEYDHRERVYLGMQYDLNERVELNMFDARDAQDRVIASARRMLRDIAFITDVDAASIATDGVALKIRSDVESGTPDQLEDLRRAGNSVWRRSRVQAMMPSWALRGCYLGRWSWEAQLNATNNSAYIVGHDPRKIRVWRDGFGTIDRALLGYAKSEGGRVLDEDGAITEIGKVTEVRKEITPDTYRTFSDRTESRADNLLGIVPVTDWKYTDIGRDLPGWAGQGYTTGLAAVDSFLTQIAVIGTRTANPTLVGKGVEIPADTDVNQLDRSVSVPADGDVFWLGQPLDGLQHLVAAADAIVSHLRTTTFEFLFTEGGASASGLALSYRASGFVAKIEPKRQAFYRELALCTSYAVAIDLGIPWSEDLDVFEVDGGEALPMDVEAMATLYIALVNEGLLAPEDAVSRMQGLGLVPDGDALEYYESVSQRASMARIDEAARVVERVSGGNQQPAPQPGDTEDEPEDSDD
jgi:hypothetical protein